MNRTPRGYDVGAASVAAATVMIGESVTRQEFEGDADINELVRRFGVTGQMPAPASRPEYGDFSLVSDFHSAMDAILDAESRFELLPSEIRERFRNDPGELLAFLDDEANHGEAVDLGLLPAEAAPEPPPPADPEPEPEPDPPSS